MKVTMTASSIVFSLGVLILAGCSETNNTVAKNDTTIESETKASESTDSVSQDYVSPLPDDAPVYTVATEASYEPFVSQDKYGNSQGLDVDLIRAIGETQGFKVEFNTMPWEEVYGVIQANKYDIAMSGIHVEANKQATFGITNPYLKDKIQIVTTVDSDIYTIEDLTGKKIGAQLGTYLVDLAKDIPDSRVNSSPTTFKMFQNLVQDKTDAFLVDKAIALYMSDQFPEFEVRLNNFGDESHEIAFYTNKDNRELLSKINQGLQEIKQDGRYQEINKKWFGDAADELMVP